MLPFYQGCCIFQSLHFGKVFQDVPRRFCANSNSEKLDPKILSGPPSHTSRRPLVSRSKVASVRTSWQQIWTLFRIRFFRSRHVYGKTAASVRTPEQHLSDMVLIMVITCSRSTTVRTLGQHYPDAALTWKRVERVMESRLHRRPSGHSQLPSGRCLEKSV
jgi:hypothetical protein